MNRSKPRPRPLCRIPAVFILCCFAALAGASALAAERPVDRGERSPAAHTGRPELSHARRVPGITIRLATPDRGIEGRIRGEGTSVDFTSRKSEDGLTATIVGADGSVLYEYREPSGETMQIQASDGSSIELRQPPELRVRGVLYESSTPELLAALRSLAASREGRLIRRLGLELFLAAPGSELTGERRGLELATQALWPHFTAGGPPAPPLTTDYEVTNRGYVVLTQPYDLVLATNRAVAALPWEKHNDSKVNNCFGRCGSGCTGGFLGIDFWPSHWTDTYGTKFVYKQEIWCVTGEDWVYTWYATPTHHSVDGWWTPGCQLHDNCCRSLTPLGCATLCNVVAPLAPLTDPLGEVRTWSYSDYSWDIQQYSLGYSGCTCPDAPAYAIIYECMQ